MVSNDNHFQHHMQDDFLIPNGKVVNNIHSRVRMYKVDPISL